ncbi:lectin subunit alpha-like [Calliphora vicina]|uniref:lectin subunit alpha-like n=1 Tax=Calliphora vicina TaxID=7373 RepID=UPI00325AFE70
MSLVTIDTEIKSQDITDLLTEIQVFDRHIHLWIGGAGRGTKFFWVSTGKQFIYTNWATNTPYYQGDDTYCTQIGWRDDIKWFDYWCYRKNGFMCEYSLYYHCQEEMHTKLQEEIKKQDELKLKLEEMLSAPKVDSESKQFRDLILNINQSKC